MKKIILTAIYAIFIGFTLLFCCVYAYGIFTGKIPSSHEKPVCTCVCPPPEKAP